MLFCFFWGAIVYLETVFRSLCTAKLIDIGLFYTVLFSAPIAMLLFLVCSLFKPEIRKKVVTGIVTLLCILFVSQFIYFKIFRMFYSLYSVSKGSQIFEFWQIISLKLRNNFTGVVMYFIPLLVCIVFRSIMCDEDNLNNKKRIRALVTMAGMQIVALLCLNIAGREAYSPYDLYYKHHYPVIAAEKIGLLTTLRLDVKRSLLNISPQLNSSTQDVTVIKGATTDKAYENKNKDTDDLAENEGKQYNVLNIDFDKLLSSEASDELKEMDEYFKNIKPTAKNEYTGKYKGYNLIQITAESFSPYAISKELTPTLYKLSHEGYQFTNFYTPLWELSTSDGEYAINMSQIPKSGTWSMKESSNKKEPFVLGNELKSLGYKTMAFHNHNFDFYDRQLSHPNMGFIYQAEGNGLEVTDVWPESDEEMMELSVERYVNNTPFYTYYMTVSGHMQYSFDENAMSIKHESEVENLDMSEDARAYLACQIELDKAVENMLRQLDEAGVLNNTLILITPDHYPYGLNNEYISELAGKTVDEQFDIYKSTLILWTPGMQPEVIDKPCSSLDILPTLSNLMGIDYDSRLYVGTDIFSDSDPLVILYSHNFITGKGRYNAISREFVENVNANVDKDYVNDIINQVEKKFYFSAKVLDTDYYAHILEGIS